MMLLRMMCRCLQRPQLMRSKYSAARLANGDDVACGLWMRASAVDSHVMAECDRGAQFLG
jgi:hypothetical protein